MAEYAKTSPWYNTPMNNTYLELLEPRDFSINDTDYPYEIESRFRHRPDLLSYSLYDTPKLWWVFSKRNPTLLKDPIFDFEPGLVIYIPRADILKASLGV